MILALTIPRDGEPSKGDSGRGDGGAEDDPGENVGEFVSGSSDLESSLFLLVLEAPEGEFGKVGRSVGEFGAGDCSITTPLSKLGRIESARVRLCLLLVLSMSFNRSGSSSKST